MNLERLQLKGMLVEAKKHFRDLDTEASGLIILTRSLLNPYEKIINLDMEKIVALVLRLKYLQSEIKIVSEKIKKLEAEFE